MVANAGIRVSGVITTYDRPALLAEAIASALKQTLPLVELFVVDDCSPSDVARVVASFDSRVHYLRQPTNQGPSAARNAGVRAASGDVIAFLDDDDQWLPEKIERQAARLAAGYEAVLCGWQLADGSHVQLCDVDAITSDALRMGNPFGGTSDLMARREALLDEPFDESLRWAEDWDIYVRLARRRPLAYVRAPLVQRRFGTHEGLTVAARKISLEALERRAGAARKHRAWLGEWGYRNALARALLQQMSTRPDRHRQLAHAIRRAGALATVATLLLMYRRARHRRHGVTP